MSQVIKAHDICKIDTVIESLEFHINNIDLLADGVNIFTGQANLVRVNGSESFDDQPAVFVNPYGGDNSEIRPLSETHECFITDISDDNSKAAKSYIEIHEFPSPCFNVNIEVDFLEIQKSLKEHYLRRKTHLRYCIKSHEPWETYALLDERFEKHWAYKKPLLLSGLTDYDQKEWVEIDTTLFIEGDALNTEFGLHFSEPIAV